MENQKESCENLYQEHLKLKARINETFRSRDNLKESGPPPPWEGMERFKDVKKELREKCKPFLDLGLSEWFEIER